MKQPGLGPNLSTMRTRKRESLDEMKRVAPWAALMQVVVPDHHRAKPGQLPFGIETMLRIHCLQQRFALSDRRWMQWHLPKALAESSAKRRFLVGNIG
ncbi:hypothetical protein IP87_21400 [beta proteobacterium AAP121]|nr:hypothetical protein IP80_20050 [beta proteobacterium AAP65]KPF90234.1 hypothetical protein IP87_21400 [beta proteobacterium AAP121]